MEEAVVVVAIMVPVEGARRAISHLNLWIPPSPVQAETMADRIPTLLIYCVAWKGINILPIMILNLIHAGG